MRARVAFDEARTEGVLIHDALLHVVETGQLPITANPLEGALSRYAGLIRTAAAEATYHRNRSIFYVGFQADLGEEVAHSRTAAAQLAIVAAFIDAGVEARHDAIGAGAGAAWPEPVPRSGRPTSSASTSDGLELIGCIAGDLREQLDHCAKIINEVVEGLTSRLAYRPGTRFQEVIPVLQECFVAAGFASLALREVSAAAAAASLAKSLGAARHHLDRAAVQANVAQNWSAAHDALLNRVAPIAADARQEVAIPGSPAPYLVAAIDQLIVAAADQVYREPVRTILVGAVSAAADDVARLAST